MRRPEPDFAGAPRADGRGAARAARDLGPARPRGDGDGAARGVHRRRRPQARLRGHPHPDRLGPDDLAAVHGRAHLRGGRRPAGRPRARRRHRLGLPGGRARRAGGARCTRSSACASSPSAPAGSSTRPATSACRSTSATARSATPSTRRSTRSPSRPRRPSCPQSLYDQLVAGRPARHPGRRPPRPAARGRRQEPGRARGRALGRVPLRPAGGRGGLLSRFRAAGAEGMPPAGCGLFSGPARSSAGPSSSVTCGSASRSMRSSTGHSPAWSGSTSAAATRRTASCPTPRARCWRIGSPSSPRSCSSRGSSTSIEPAGARLSGPARRGRRRPGEANGDARGSPHRSARRGADDRRGRAARRGGGRSRTRASRSGTMLSAPPSN